LEPLGDAGSGQAPSRSPCEERTVTFYQLVISIDFAFCRFYACGTCYFFLTCSSGVCTDQHTLRLCRQHVFRINLHGQRMPSTLLLVFEFVLSCQPPEMRTTSGVIGFAENRNAITPHQHRTFHLQCGSYNRGPGTVTKLMEPNQVSVFAILVDILIHICRHWHSMHLLPCAVLLVASTPRSSMPHLAINIHQ
jgi:hypothetical protein